MENTNTEVTSTNDDDNGHLSYYRRILKNIEDGKLGKNIGIPIGLPSLNYFLGGLRKKKYILLGSNTGVGKTAFVDYVFIIYPLFWILKQADKNKKKLKVVYYSFEIDLDSKLIKWASLLLYLDKGIIVDPDVIISSKRKLNDLTEIEKIPLEIENQIKELEYYFNFIEDHVEIIDTVMNPTGIYNKMKEVFKQHGTLESKTSTYINKKTNKEVTRTREYYIPNDPDLTVLLVIDHYGLLKLETIQGIANKSKKSSIDKLSEYIIELRNKYQMSAIMISQFNRDIGDVNRHKQSKEIKPQLEDFKETGTTADDADLVLAPFNPSRYDIANYKKYDLTASQYCKFLRWLFILKNRGGNSDVSLGLRLLGQCGYFEEIPKTPPDTLSSDGLAKFYKDIGNFKIDLKNEYST